jgi:hypothetical protein
LLVAGDLNEQLGDNASGMNAVVTNLALQTPPPVTTASKAKSQLAVAATTGSTAFHARKLLLHRSGAAVSFHSTS